jgi:hypothetical protein
VTSFYTYTIASSISSFEENSQSLRICFNISKCQKGHGLIYIWWIGPVRHARNMVLLRFWVNFRSGAAHSTWNCPCAPKVDPIFWRRKFRFAIFKSGNMLLMKYNWLKCYLLEEQRTR